MSKKNLIHSDHYKILGRGKPGEQVQPEKQNQKLAQAARKRPPRREKS